MGTGLDVTNSFALIVARMAADVGGGKPCVRMEVRSKGTVVIELHNERTPITVENFLGYVDSGFYSGLTFHRVISGFMVQGGGLDSKMVSASRTIIATIIQHMLAALTV